MMQARLFSQRPSGHMNFKIVWGNTLGKRHYPLGSGRVDAILGYGTPPPKGRALGGVQLESAV
jgi:hypothetical protein